MNPHLHDVQRVPADSHPNVFTIPSSENLAKNKTSLALSFGHWFERSLFRRCNMKHPSACFVLERFQFHIVGYINC